MYLESIFIGGDIRAQLPEEAKKFDSIDKTFKKVNKNRCNDHYMRISGPGTRRAILSPPPPPPPPGPDNLL